MNTEAFVYIWTNLSNGNFYIGYHKGNTEDGYICSSKNNDFWDDFNNINNKWKREIVFYGTASECLIEEQRLLDDCNIRSEFVYNNARGSKIMFTQVVLEKMSLSAKKRWKNISEEKKKERSEKISKAKKGVPRSEETKKKISETLKGKSFVDRYGEEKAKLIGNKISKTNTGKKKPKQSIAMKGRFCGKNSSMFGKTHSEEFKQKKREYFLTNNPGKNKSEETKKKMSENRKGKPTKTNKPLIIYGVEYRTLKEAADALKIAPMTVRCRVLSKKIEFNQYNYK